MSRSDALWIAELKTGRPGVLSELRAALLRNLGRALAHRTGVDHSFLEDAVQESLLRILERIDQFSGRSRFLTWATTIAIHQALGELRLRRWQDVSLDDFLTGSGTELTPTADGNAAPDAHLTRQDLLNALQRSIECDLTDRQRTALLAELKGMPQDEIARRLGSNRNAIYKLTHDGRKKLKTALEAAGYSADDVIATIGS